MKLLLLRHNSKPLLLSAGTSALTAAQGRLKAAQLAPNRVRNWFYQLMGKTAYRQYSEFIFKTIGKTDYFENRFKPINWNGSEFFGFVSAVHFVQILH